MKLPPILSYFKRDATDHAADIMHSATTAHTNALERFTKTLREAFGDDADEAEGRSDGH